MTDRDGGEIVARRLEGWWVIAPWVGGCGHGLEGVGDG